jgi:integrase/recombinase XerC
MVASRVVAVMTWTAEHGPAMPVAEAIGMAVQLVTDGPLADPTVARYGGLWVAFRRFCLQVGAEALGDVTPEVVDRWLRTLTRRGKPPSAATMHLRRTAIKHLFTVLRTVGASRIDPTLDLDLPERLTLRCRGFTDDELALVRSASLSTTVETRLPTIVALAEAGATSAEIPQITRGHLDAARTRVWLPGHTKTDPRWARLSDWGAAQVRRRIHGAPDGTGPLTYEGEGPIESAQASTSAALRTVLNRAGLSGRPGIALKSFRVARGLGIHAETGRIEDAAIALGMQSLDQAAAVLGIDWRDHP